MYNITLISSFHSEVGNCTSDELYKIISVINPEVIFEELPESLFDRVYNGSHYPNEPLEVKCIKNYIPDYIKHIPVDIDTPDLSFSEVEFMFSMFKKYTTYQLLENEQRIFTEQYGFAYLNSESCSESFYKKKNMEQSLLAFGISSAFPIRRVYEQFEEVQNNREHAMISNIYNYSKEKPFNQAVFLIGCAHRNSMVQKIVKYNEESDFKLNWTFYGN